MLGADAENRRMWKCSDWQKSNMMMMRLWCMKEQIATVEQNASLTVACGMYMYIQYKSLSSQCEWIVPLLLSCYISKWTYLYAASVCSYLVFKLDVGPLNISTCFFDHYSSLVNKTFLSRPRPRLPFFIETKTFSQDQGKTFYFEIKTKSKTFCRSAELAAIWNITSTNAVIS